MALVIEDFRGKYQVDSIGELEAVLSKRYGPEANAFWLSRADHLFPAMSLLVMSEFATLLYVPNEGHPGFTPVAPVPGLDNERFSTFRVDTVEQELEVSNSQVVPLSTALSAARDFFASGELPQSMAWTEL